MSSLLSAQKISIPLYYKMKDCKNGMKKVVIIAEKDEEKAKQVIEKEKNLSDEQKTVRLLNTSWKSLNWRESNRLTRDSQVTSASGSQELDFFVFRDLRLKTALIDWDLRDDNNNLITVEPKAVDSLPSDIVFELLSRYDKAVSVVEEDEKKVT